MLKLSAAHLREQRKQDPSKRLVWLDIGGGTGESKYLKLLM
jgi:betaine lipid synthase